MWVKQNRQRNKTRNLEQKRRLIPFLGTAYPQCQSIMLVIHNEGWYNTKKIQHIFGASELLQGLGNYFKNMESTHLQLEQNLV